MNRPISGHPRMSNEQRAAQFAAFRALTGYEDEVNDQAELFRDMIENEVEGVENPDKFEGEVPPEFDI